ncbi:winged helix-turn-helix domain-containing protein [Paenibacillus sp. FSL H7-0350]|uniref:winged helix-turn-helix domain-containing protein n=1 Tax=Paenibacillus sp. FSL H7-0350 TaxID=2975345 RepID=UPI00315966B9
MRVIPKPGILNQLQEDKKMTEQEFADFLGASRSSLWRAKLPVDDNRFSLGQDVMAKILKNFPEKSFEDIFFLEHVSQVCYGNTVINSGGI